MQVDWQLNVANDCRVPADETEASILTGYDPYEPQNQLIEIGERIWIADGPVLPWNGMPFPTRMTVVLLDDGSVWVNSPIALVPDLAAAVERLGIVRHLVSPNKIHHVSIGAWAARFPGALVWASPGVRRRSSVAFDRDLEDRPPPDWAACIDQRIAHGSWAMEEVVFFHKPSRTLILADLIENFERERLNGWFARTLARLGGVLAPDGKAPLDLRLSFLGRKDEMRDTVAWMLACAPERVVIAHGKWFDKDGTAEVNRAFAWTGS